MGKYRAAQTIHNNCYFPLRNILTETQLYCCTVRSPNEIVDGSLFSCSGQLPGNRSILSPLMKLWMVRLFGLVAS